MQKVILDTVVMTEVTMYVSTWTPRNTGGFEPFSAVVIPNSEWSFVHVEMVSRSPQPSTHSEPTRPNQGPHDQPLR